MTTKPRFDCFKHALAFVELCQQHRAAFYAMQAFISGEPYSEARGDKSFADACGVFHQYIYKKELEAWRQVFMFALTLSPEQQTEVRALAYRRFMTDGKSVMYLMNDTNASPPSWNGSDEDELRAWLKEHFKEEA